MRNILLALAAVAALTALAVPFAPVTYVDKAVSNVLVQAKTYAENVTPKVDFSQFVAKSNANLRVDTATNVVWKCVWSNGIEYVFAYSNNTNIINEVSE